MLRQEQTGTSGTCSLYIRWVARMSYTTHATIPKRGWPGKAITCIRQVQCVLLLIMGRLDLEGMGFAFGHTQHRNHGQLLF